MPRVNWVKSVLKVTSRNKRPLGEHVSHPRVGSVVAQRMISMVGSPAFAVPIHHHDVVAGHAAHDVEHSISPSTDLMWAVCLGAAITVSRASGGGTESFQDSR